MAYVSLYRKYRPQTFSEVVGQRHVITSLQNAIREDALGHAYLFAGPRGTGKTTIARILAMAINATGGPNADPDPFDPIAVAIRAGQSMDVIELDMASHGGVDDARELRDRAVYAPVELRKKVYILDEVHMASQAAFNALLKLIEEPPPHVMFVMATTDPQKVLPTILSRVQRLDLRRVGTADLGVHVRRLAELEGFTIDDAALAQVLRAGEGSVRDTLSVLEQVAAFAGAGASDAGTGTVVTEEHAAAVLGRTPLARTIEVVDHLVAGNVAGTFVLVQSLLDDGHDLRRFTLDLVQHLRDLLVVQAAPSRPDLIDASDEHRAALADQATRLSRERLVFAVDVLGSILVEQRTGPPRLPLELALARLAVPAASGDFAALASRVAALEAGAPAAARATIPVVAAPALPATPTVPAAAVPEVVAPAASPPDPQDVSDAVEAADAEDVVDDAADAADAADAPVPEAPSAPSVPSVPEAVVPVGEVTAAVVAARWEAILEVVLASSKKAYAMYVHGQPARLHNQVLTLTYSPDKSFHREQALTSDLMATLRAAVQQTCGIAVNVDAVIDGEVDRRPSHPSVTPADATVPTDPFTGGDPNEGRPAEPADLPVEQSPDPAADGDESTTSADEQSQVREAEFDGEAGPDGEAARAGILSLLEATEVDASELA